MNCSRSLAPAEQLELLPVALGEPHLELIALAEDHQVRVAVRSRIAAGMRTEQDDASHGRVRRELIDEPLDRLIHPANVLPVTASDSISRRQVRLREQFFG
jgi:hypothetical protein